MVSGELYACKNQLTPGDSGFVFKTCWNDSYGNLHPLLFLISGTVIAVPSNKIDNYDQAKDFIFKKVNEIGKDQFHLFVVQFLEQDLLESYKKEIHTTPEIKNSLQFYKGEKDQLIDKRWYYHTYPRIIFLNS